MISDMTVPAHLETPPQVELRTSAVDSLRLGIWCKDTISADQIFGPFLGGKTLFVNEDMDTTFMWEVLDEKTQEVLHYIDATNPEKGNWMRYINCAHCFEEQNIVLQQTNGEIFYKAIKDIYAGEELLTWYSKSSFKYKIQPRRSKRGRKPSRHLEPLTSQKKQRHKFSLLEQKKTIIKPKIKDFQTEVESLENQEELVENIFEPPEENDLNEIKSTADFCEKEIKEKEEDNEQIITNCDKIDSSEVLEETVKDEAESDVSSSPGSLKIDEFKTEGEEYKDIDSEKEVSEAKPGEFQFELKSHHIVKGRVGRKVFRCDICSGVYRHAFSLKRHFLRTHINYRYLSATDISNCNININSQELALHAIEVVKSENESSVQVQIITENTNNENEENDASLAQSNQDMESAKNKIDSIEKKDAKIKTFCQNKSNLAELYRCHICSAFYDRLHELKSHISNHPQLPSTKSFACNQCDMTFSHKQNLVRHLSVHSGEKPYSCKFCGRCFPTVTNQRRHERIHMGLKPFSCQHCSSVFTQSGDLKKHVRRQHKEKFHPCAFCTKYFGTVEQLEEHLLKHGETIETNGKMLVRQHASARLEQRAITIEQAVVKVKLASKTRNICNICFKMFSTFHNLCRHQRHVHQNNNKTRLVYNHMETSKSNAPVEKSEDLYMENVSQNILENFLHYLDGRIEHIPKIAKHEGVIEESNIPGNLEWTKYNFPVDFDLPSKFGNEPVNSTETITPEMSQKNNVSKGPGELTIKTLKKTSDGKKDKILLENYAKAESQPQIDGYICDICSALYKSFVKYAKHMKTRHKKKISSKNGKKEDLFNENSESLDLFPDTTYICCVCKDSFIHIIDFEVHQQQMHPHVDCTYIELENSNGPSTIPPEFWLQFCDPVGFLSQTPIPVTTLSQYPGNFTCTKCGQICNSMEALHSHILDCADSPKPPTPLVPFIKKRGRPPGRRLTKKGLKRKRKMSVDTPIPKTPEKKDKTSLVTNQKKQLNFDLDVFYPRQDPMILQKIKLMCDNCNKSFNYGSALERHSKMCYLREKVRHHNGPSTGVRQKDILQRHSCPYCRRSFTYLASLRKHIHDFCPQRVKSEEASPETSPESSEVDPKEDSKLEMVSPKLEPKLENLILLAIKKSPRGRPPGRKNKLSGGSPIIMKKRSKGSVKEKKEPTGHKELSSSKSHKCTKNPKKMDDLNLIEIPPTLEIPSAIDSLHRMLNALKLP